MNSLQPSSPETPDSIDIQKNKDIAAFSYIWIMSVLIYFSRKDSKFVHHHSKQGIVLFLMTIPLSFIPYVGQYLIFLAVAGMLLGFMNAAAGQTRDVPLVGKLSRGELSIKELAYFMIDEGKKISRSGMKYLAGHFQRKHLTKTDEVSGPISSSVKWTE